MIVALAVGTHALSQRQTAYGIAQVLNAALGSCGLACVRSGGNASFSSHRGGMSFRYVHSLVFIVVKNKQADRRG